MLGAATVVGGEAVLAGDGVEAVAGVPAVGDAVAAGDGPGSGLTGVIGPGDGASERWQPDASKSPTALPQRSIIPIRSRFVIAREPSANEVGVELNPAAPGNPAEIASGASFET